MWCRRKMKPFTLSKAFAATAAVCLVATAVLWVLNFDSMFLSHLDENLDWTTVLVPRAYFLVLYLVAAGAFIGALWFRVRGRKKPLIDYVAGSAVVAGVVAVVVVLLAHRPPLPAFCSKLRAGMTAEEVRGLLGMHDQVVYQWDRRMILEHYAPMLGGDGGWNVELSFAAKTWSNGFIERLEGATATYGHRLRLLGSRPIECLGSNAPQMCEAEGRRQYEHDLAVIESMGLVERAKQDFSSRVTNAIIDKRMIRYFMRTNTVVCVFEYRLPGGGNPLLQEFCYTQDGGTNWRLMWGVVVPPR